MDFWLYDHANNERRPVTVEGEPVTIGRDDACDIVLKGAFVARRHARIVRKGNQFFVENLSRSALTVAGRDASIGQSVRVDFGDEIQVAQYSVVPIGTTRAGGNARETDRRLMQSRLVAFEQQVHSELLDRMNLRVTAHVDKSDSQYVTQVLNHLEEILGAKTQSMDETLQTHTVHLHLHRLVTSEVMRQCQGKVQTDYQAADSRQLDPARERAVHEVVSSIVDMMPLIFDPTSVAEDLALAEEAYDDLFNQVLPTISKNVQRYIVQRTVAKDIQDIMFGLGPLQDLLEMGNVSEIMVVGKDRIYVEKNGVIQPTTRSFFSDDTLLSVIERILSPVGRRVDTSNPLVDARLSDGSRVNVVISPLSLVGPILTIRKFGWIPFTIDDLVERRSISPQCAEFLKACVIGRKNIIVSGGTGSGKTTLLNTLCAYARANERIVTVEESAELRLPQPHVVALEGRPANVEGRGAFTIRDLVRNALRMRPDRIIVGEVRGPEALDMLQAMNTGHDGSLSTLHANAPPEASQRLETLVLMAVDMPVRAIREQIVTAIDVIVQVARFPNGHRRVTHISEVTTLDRETSEVQIEDIFVLRDPEQDRLRHTGYIPSFTEAMVAKGTLGVEVFL
ncbi:MAG: FHA domain-containing protein [Phycisphaera sp.]|nr:FHA domain-containing protein [Phycisphaera sp.]